MSTIEPTGMNDDRNPLWDALYDDRDGDKDRVPPREARVSAACRCERFAAARMRSGELQERLSSLLEHSGCAPFLVLLETILNRMPEGLLVADADGQVLTMNRAALDLHGHAALEAFRTEDAFADRYEFRDLHDNLLPNKQWPLQRAVRGEAFSACEVQVRRLDTGARWYASYNGTPLYDEDGEVLLALLTFRDVTEHIHREHALAAAKERVEAACQTQRDFLARMSHEIRTPLTGILGFAGVLAKAVDPQHRTFARLIERSGQRLRETLEAVLALAKFEAGQMTLERAPLRIAEEVEATFQLFAQEAGAKQLHYGFHVAPDARKTHAHVDRGALSIIVQNLIANAIKYTEAGEVTVTVDVAPPDTVQIEVADTGIGIDEAFLPRLFDPFTRESERWGRTYDGSGLGLSIARQFAERMDGTIAVDSEKGVGSRFTVSLPAVRSPDEGPACAELPCFEGADFRVLVVEDDSTTQLLLRVLLAERCDVTLVSTATRALDVIHERRTEQAPPPFDMILVDVCLRGALSGTDLLARLREMADFRKIPVVALTAHAPPRNRGSFRESGFDACLEKPFTPSELFSLITQMMD